MQMQHLSVRDMTICALFTALITAGALIRIPVPVVPFTLQFLFTNLAGLLLGKKLGSIAVLVYIILGLIGLPIFSSGGGPGYLLQPTFGYLPGFMIGAWLSGYILEKKKEQPTKKTYLWVGLINLLVVYGIGMLYYYLIANFYLHAPIGIGALFLYCFLLAVPGDFFLCFVGALLAKRLHTILGNRTIMPTAAHHEKKRLELKQ